MVEALQGPGLQVTLLVILTAVLLAFYRTASRHDLFHLNWPSPLQNWRTRRLIQRLTTLVLLIGERTDGPLKGQVPFWLAGFNHAEAGEGIFEVLVSCQEEYFIVHFEVKRWKPHYSGVESYSTENAHQLMKAHLQALGRWEPLKTVG